MAPEKVAAPWELPLDNVIVVGAFNPNILSHAWVAAHVLGDDPGDGESQLAFGTGAVIHRFGDLFWEPTRQRLRVLGAPSKTGAFVSAILEKLPHTPVSAAGVNFARKCEQAPEGLGPFRIDIDPSRSVELLRGERVATSLSETVKREDDVILTVKITFGAEGGTVDFNYHCEAVSADSIERSNELRRHVEKSVSFEEDVKRIMGALVG